jgi:20S proteasome alpha/beta subunit
MARFIARTQQKYTQRGGMRPFGVSCMLAGFGTDGAPQVYMIRYVMARYCITYTIVLRVAVGT